MSDLIRREDVLKALLGWETDPTDEEIEYTIKSIPTAEPKVGKWIERDDGWGNVFYECSECGEAFTLIDGTPTDNLYYYCPNCGAKMERSE